MFGLPIASAPEALVVDRGNVGCVLRGRDVEIDVCAGCRWLASIGEEDGVPVVRCDPPLGFLTWINGGGGRPRSL